MTIEILSDPTFLFIKMFMFLIWNRLKESERRKVIHKKKLEEIKC